MTNENTAQSTLSHDDAAEKAVEIFKSMNVAQKKRHLDFLHHKVFNDSAWATAGTGKAEKNIPFNQQEEELDWKIVAEFLAEDQLQECLEEVGFSREVQERLTDIFFKAVEERVGHDPFRKRVQEILDQYSPPSPFITDEEIDACELLGNRIFARTDCICGE